MNIISLLTDIVLTVTGFQLFLLAVVLLKQHTKNKLSRNLLVAFLLAKAFLMLRWFLFRWDILVYNDFRFLYHVSDAVFFLLAPLLYLYIRTLCFKGFAFRKSSLFHGILFVLIIVFNFVSASIMVSSVVDEKNLTYNIFILSHYKIFWGLNFIQILCYIIVMVRTVYIYQNKLKNRYSSIEKISLNWLLTLLGLIFLHWIFVVSRAVIAMINPDAAYLTSIIDLYSISIFLVFTTILVFKGLNQLKIFPGIFHEHKYANSRLANPDLKTYTAQVKQFMERQKPYLEPGLTIEELSEKLSIPAYQLSQVINYSFRQNFYTFINSYRIEEVKQKFVDPAYRHKTILEILYDTGFNSKSTFNEVFKKYTGKTPTEFRNEYFTQQSYN